MEERGFVIDIQDSNPGLHQNYDDYRGDMSLHHDNGIGACRAFGAEKTGRIDLLAETVFRPARFPGGTSVLPPLTSAPLLHSIDAGRS